MCVGVLPGQVNALCADFEGKGDWGANVLSDVGIVLNMQDSSGQVFSSSSLKPGEVQLEAVSNDTDTA